MRKRPEAKWLWKKIRINSIVQSLLLFLSINSYEGLKVFVHVFPRNYTLMAREVGTNRRVTSVQIKEEIRRYCRG